MQMITDVSVKSNAISQNFKIFGKRFRLKALMRNRGLAKRCGVEAFAIVAFLVGLVFTKKNLYRLIEGEKLGFCKDTVYRLLDNRRVNWEHFLFDVSNEVIPEIKRLTDEGTRRYALILDDTPYYRDRSKKVELLSRCYDHSENRYYNGFNVLTLGWSDGQTFMPVDMRVVASGNAECLLEGSHVESDGRTIATKRRRDAQTAKPELALTMLRNAKGSAADCQYVLMDSWFSNPKSILDIKGLGYDVVARLKDGNTRYRHNGQLMSVGAIFRANRKRPGRSRYLLSAEIAVEHEKHTMAIPARLVFVRNRDKRKKYVVFVSTDMTLNEEDVIALYGKRWQIETFFKVCKSDLRMCKEFQSRSFDAIVAHTVIVYIRYIMLSLANREQKDPRSVCEIFHRICDELEDVLFADAVAIIFEIMTVCIDRSPSAEKIVLERFYDQFCSTLPKYIAEKLAS